MRDYNLNVGVDEADEGYVLTVVADNGQIKAEKEIAYGGDAVIGCVEWLRKIAGGDSSTVAVIFEKPWGALQEHLVELLVHVYAIDPKQVERLRDRYGMSGSKGDPKDSFVLADCFRTDTQGLQFKRVAVPDAPRMQLRILGRRASQLDKQMRAESNRLRVSLHRTVPQLLTLCNGADEPWLWALLLRASTPERLAKLPLGQLTSLLKQHRIRKFSAEDLQKLLRQPALPVADGAIVATSSAIRSTLATLTLLLEESKQTEKLIVPLLDRLRQQVGEDGLSDTDIVNSLKGVGPQVLALLMAYCDQAIKDRNLEHLRRQTGVAPVTRASGKHRHVQQRYACSLALRNAMFWAANAAVASDPHWNDLYAKLRARGKTRGRALRGVADRMLSVLVSMLRHRTLYDPERWPKNHAAQSRAPEPKRPCVADATQS